MALTPATRLGNYEIVAPLGTGGMGEVYRARDLRLGREVALKVLPADVAADAVRIARFEREARTVAGLNHPNIVTLYSVEDEDDIRFLTMELVEGRSLDEHVIAGGLPSERVTELGLAISEALVAAHEKGIVHRDLKPANVMLTRDGRVKVLDFGLAKLTGPDSGNVVAQDETVAMVSVAGQVVGTVPYMAPEQLRGEAVDARTDLFALGILLYELAAGRRPFQGATVAAISSAILRDTPPSLSGVRADVSADLDRIISRCLEKEPRARYQTALDVSNELRGARVARPGIPPPATAGAAIFKPPPAPSTTLLGREQHLQSASDRLRGGTGRVLTITGYGGTGKTRFAIELFRRMASSYPEGAAFVSLASVTAAADVLPAVGASLDVAQAHGRSALDALCTVFGERRWLLVLDNLEQVLDAAGDIAVLVSRCPGLQVIATSRAPLKIGAESEFSLPPLELPAEQETSPESLLRCPSVALFVQRAERVKPGFALTAANAQAITAICRALDGLPLALELAAARVRILDPTALLQRLDHALDLLTSGDRDLPVRQRTLRATISWSYSLLDAAEQRLLRRLSVFHQGWTFDAMEQVCYGDEDRHRALDELDSLVEKGLVRVDGSSERYALLETIRAFAAEQLHAGGEVETLRRTHAEHYRRFAEAVHADIYGKGQLAAVKRAHVDNANTMAAIQWLNLQARAGDEEALENGLLLCGYLDWFWHITAQHFTGRSMLDPLLSLAVTRPPSRGRALALLAAAMISTTTGEWERSLSEWRGALADGDAVGDARAAAEGMMGVGYCCLSLGRMAEAGAALDDAIRRSAGGVHDFLLGFSMSVKGMLLFSTGQLEDAMLLVEQAVRIHERWDDHEARGVALSFLAQMTQAKGEPARALELYHAALTHLALVGDQPEVARVQCEMGWTALAGEDPRAAKQSFRLAVQTHEEVGSPRGTGLALLGLAAVEAAEGRSERAVAIAAAAHALSERAGVVVSHPMDPTLVTRIEELKATIPKGTLDGLVANASTLSPAAILSMTGE